VLLVTCENPTLKKGLEALFPEECTACVYELNPPQSCAYSSRKISVACPKHREYIGYVAGTVAALPHAVGGWTMATAPTCTAAGTETGYCPNCEENVTRAGAAALGHDWGAWTTVGSTLTRTCVRDSSHTETLTDDTAILQALIDAAPSGGSVNLSDFPDWKLDSAVTVDKEITLTTAPGSTVTLERQGATPPINTPQTAQNAFNIKSGGKLTLTAGTGGELIVTAQATVGVPLFTISTGGELVLTAGAKITDPRTATAQNFTAIYINGGRFTMTGGEISNHTRMGAIYIGNGGSFNMTGGKIFGNA
jgi:hypothetical protein